MTSAQTMLAFLRAPLTLCAAFALLTGIGCAGSGDLTPPTVHAAPYDDVAGDVLWAVVPLRNESGTSQFSAEAVSDEVVAAAQQARGVSCLPLNRTIAAMRALGLNRVDTPEQAKELAQAMGVDGLIVGSVTAYDPYTPVLGLSLALYGVPGPMYAQDHTSLDPRWLTPQPTEHSMQPAQAAPVGGPASVAITLYDARGHDTLLEVQRYASGRTENESAFGWRRYTASMGLFTKFAAHSSVGELLREEWLRMARVSSRRASR